MNNPLTPQQIEDVMAVVQDVFRQFRPTILERAGNVAHTDKDDGSPVTNTDVEVEQKLQVVLAAHFPDLPVYGEEGGYEDTLSGTFWLIDPIDGTKSFIKNVPAFTSMAVLVQEGEAAACVIYNPSTDAMYIATKGGGAFKNGTRLDLNALPLPHVALCKETHIEALNAVLRDVAVACEVAPSGGGHGFTMVAEGLAAARFNLHSRGSIHDYAPGGLLVREAGGVVVPVLDDEYTYKTSSFIACHPQLETVIRQHVAALRALEQ